MLTMEAYKQAKAEYLRLDAEEKRIKKLIEEEVAKYGDMDRRFRLKMETRLESEYGLPDVWKAKIEAENRLLEIGKEVVKYYSKKYGLTLDQIENAFQKIDFNPIYREQVVGLVLSLDRNR